MGAPFYHHVLRLCSSYVQLKRCLFSLFLFHFFALACGRRSFCFLCCSFSVFQRLVLCCIIRHRQFRMFAVPMCLTINSYHVRSSWLTRTNNKKNTLTVMLDKFGIACLQALKTLWFVCCYNCNKKEKNCQEK